MTIRLKVDSRACLLDSTPPGTLAHDMLSGAPVVSRAGDAPGGLYEIDCTETVCEELLKVASKHCPGALRELEAQIGRQTRS